MDTSIFSKFHGAATHFPIALMLVSAACDIASIVVADPKRQSDFRFAATLTLTLGAIGSYAAVVSGLMLSHWQVWGHGTLLRHHMFVWPAFVLMTGLATWRLATSRRAAASRPAVTYLVLMLLASALMGGAGYWGGELLNRG